MSNVDFMKNYSKLSINFQKIFLYYVLEQALASKNPIEKGSFMFSKKELMLFVFSWIKTFKRSIFTFIKYFWWLLAIDVTLQTQLLTLQNQTYLWATISLFSIITMFSAYFAILSIRASLETKNYLYFITNLKKIFGFAVIYLSLFFGLNAVIMFTTGISSHNWALSVFTYGIHNIIQTTGVFLLITATFFLVDSQDRISGITQAVSCTIKGVSIYFLPFISILTLYILSYYGTTFVFSFFPNVIRVIGLTTLRFFFICALAVFHLKIRYCNFKVLFGG